MRLLFSINSLIAGTLVLTFLQLYAAILSFSLLFNLDLVGLSFPLINGPSVYFLGTVYRGVVLFHADLRL